jgi:hypothetical protein
MIARFIISDYAAAMEDATCDKRDARTFAGCIPSCPGAIAFGTTLRACEGELRGTLGDWILVGLRLGHPLPGL